MPMQPYKRIALVVVIVLLAAASAAVYFTGDRRGSVSRTNRQDPNGPQVDLRPLQTAQSLATLAVGPDEQGLARDAVRISDHELDLNFTEALYQAASQKPLSTPEIRATLVRIATAEKNVAQADEDVARVTKLLATAPENQKKDTGQQLLLAKAQLELDENELADADEDLSRAGGDPQSRIQSMVDAHNAADHESGGPADTMEMGTKAGSLSPTSSSFLAQGRAWYALHAYLKRLRAAQKEAASLAASLSQLHDELAPKIAQARTPRPNSANTSAAANPASPGSTRVITVDAAMLSSMRSLTAEQRRIASLDHRIHDEQDLASIYNQWAVLAAARQRSVTHALLIVTVWMLSVALAVILFIVGMDRFFDHMTPDKKKLLTLRTVIDVAARAFGTLLILMLIFGPPNQMATVLALAGAGLTVALKDFIVGFFGWFILMGKNGIRVGDWVEINGVSGEVVEIGLFHTMLLETGPEADSGHPTGRRVTFINSYAIEGHYFNFSTSGQWLWDELQIVIPADLDPDPIVAEIQAIVTKETEANTREAEQEWAHVGNVRGMRTFSAGPAISLRPANMSLEILVRYVTRANERHQQRSKLYYEIVELLRRRNVPEGAQPALPQPGTPQPSAPQTA